MAMSSTEIDAGLMELSGWTRAGEAITRQFTLASFREAIAFLVRVAFEAEQRDHHPEIWNVYNRVKLTLATHDAGGVTAKDFDLARAIDALR